MSNVETNTQRLLDLALRRRKIYAEDPVFIVPWRRPCVVRTLLVTDGPLDFGLGDFGLSTFVDILLNEKRSYVVFELTLAHRSAAVTDAQVMEGAPGIAESIKGFRFDNAAHFTPDMYDEVWLFGFDSGPDMGDPELLAASAHMNRGGGLFATGDHGSLGKALCGKVNRVRSMRYWDDFPAPGPLNESDVSMGGYRRNDTNQIGRDVGSQFSDQSDDIPQLLDLKLYSTSVGLLREALYPHPLMCSRLGRINLFPDHPHEGECREPASLTEVYDDGLPEYPPALDGSGPVAPEIVARGHVPAGNRAIVNNAFTKDPTVAHDFGVVSAYDGHLAGVGRVVCDSTWHHFVNVNLIGVLEGGGFDDFPRPGGGGTPGTDPSKHDGFLSSTYGQAVLAKIKEYYLNVGVWMAPPDRHQCFHIRNWWDTLWSDRVVEATLLAPDTPAAQVRLGHLFHIGVHARGVLGERIGACQTLEWVLPVIKLIWPEIIIWIDPWERRRLEIDRLNELEPRLPWFDIQPLIDVAIGGALVALRQEFPSPTVDLDDADARLEEIVLGGAADALRHAMEEIEGDVRRLNRLLRHLGDESSDN